MKKTITAFALFATAGAAFAGIEITEIYAGMTGEDGTEDWFEVTYYGAGTFDTGSLWYDDESADPTVNAQLTSFQLSDGESAIFLQGGGASDIADFFAIWGNVANVGIADGGGGLSQNGDSIFLFDGNMAGANVVDSVAFDGSFANMLATLQVENDGTVSLSQLGVNGAYESNPFFNDNLGLPNDEATLIGSPVPTPGVLALLGLGGLTATRRRR